MTNDKIKISQKEFNDIYEIEKEITEEIKEVPLSAKPLEDTTPDIILSDEEQEQEDTYLENYKIPEGADVT